MPERLRHALGARKTSAPRNAGRPPYKSRTRKPLPNVTPRDKVNEIFAWAEFPSTVPLVCESLDKSSASGFRCRLLEGVIRIEEILLHPLGPGRASSGRVR
jgi:hypothetical protein